MNQRLSQSRWVAAVLALVVGFCALPGFAENDAPAYPELKTASKFSRILQTVTGITPVSGWIANRILRRELAEHVQGDLHAKLKLFSATDLLGGKARHIRISGRDVLLEDLLPVSEFHFENIDDMPLYVSKDRRPILLRPVQFRVSVVMDEADINRMLASEKGRKMLTAMDVTIPPFGRQSFDALEPSVDIEAGKITIRSLMNIHNTPRENALPVTVSGKIAAERSTLSLSELDLEIPGIAGTAAVAQVVEDYFSELVDLRKIKVERHRVKIAFEQSELKDDRLNLRAVLTVEPEKKALQKYLSQKTR